MATMASDLDRSGAFARPRGGRGGRGRGGTASGSGQVAHFPKCVYFARGRLLWFRSVTILPRHKNGLESILRRFTACRTADTRRGIKKARGINPRATGLFRYLEQFGKHYKRQQ